MYAPSYSIKQVRITKFCLRLFRLRDKYSQAGKAYVINAYIPAFSQRVHILDC
jgi:hypothetical protein